MWLHLYSNNAGLREMGLPCCLDRGVRTDSPASIQRWVIPGHLQHFCQLSDFFAKYWKVGGHDSLETAHLGAINCGKAISFAMRGVWDDSTSLDLIAMWFPRFPDTITATNDMHMDFFFKMRKCLPIPCSSLPCQPCTSQLIPTQRRGISVWQKEQITLCFTARALKTLPLNQAPVWLNSLHFTCIPMLN